MVSGSVVARAERAGGLRLGRVRGRSGPGASASEPLSESEEEGWGVSGLAPAAFIPQFDFVFENVPYSNELKGGTHAYSGP